MSDGRLVVVTGGAGYLGDTLVEQLLDDPEIAPREVRVFDRRPSPRRGHPRVTERLGDLRDATAVRRALAGADLVVHAGAMVDWGRVSPRTLEAVNVGGTVHVVEACLAEGVPALVHTSTLDVVYSGHAVYAGDESLPYPRRFPNAYCRTKAQAEQRALAADGRPLGRPGPTGERRLRTTVVRPCSIFGEGDPFHIGSLVAMAERGRLFRVGDGSARSQFSYLGNVAHCHVLAARSLLRPDPRAAGQVYFATDFEAANFFDFLAPFVEAAGYAMPPASRGLPRGPLYALGATLEGVAAVTRPVLRWQPLITRFAVDFVAKDFIIRSDKAARELGYAPRFDREEAFARTAAWFADRAAASGSSTRDAA
jgi:sterol-4alpha-carboxylate 3-dehydrogenase (decarboxylating)